MSVASTGFHSFASSVDGSLSGYGNKSKISGGEGDEPPNDSWPRLVYLETSYIGACYDFPYSAVKRVNQVHMDWSSFVKKVTLERLGVMAFQIDDAANDSGCGWHACWTCMLRKSICDMCLDSADSTVCHFSTTLRQGTV